jgi:hypothetical protein
VGKGSGQRQWAKAVGKGKIECSSPMAFLLHFQIYAWYHMVQGCSTAFFCDSRLHALSRVYHVQQPFFLTTKQATSIGKTTTVTSTPKLTSQLKANPYAAPEKPCT